MRTDMGLVDVIDWTERVMAEAIDFAEREIAAIEQARAYHLAEAVKRGTCAVGHRLDLPDIPINSLGTAPCGYCTNTRETMR
jgi:hypothetical protein